MNGSASSEIRPLGGGGSLILGFGFITSLGEKPITGGVSGCCHVYFERVARTTRSPCHQLSPHIVNQVDLDRPQPARAGAGLPKLAS
ncbi:hypothetical protein E2C01_100431 [Portunus trituberculatus]|uniref:Uncharacterized protein n=1 Tax=Portunus trituberculatus TaxID=210409 RepID=A0A5B7KD20_PORTR|nr:hypothetical protein [Portunus trituberculatus]